MKCINIGGQCEKLWWQTAEKKAIQEREERLWLQAVEKAKATGLPEDEWPKERPLRTLWKAAQEVPTSQRREWRLANKGQNIDDIHFAMAEEQGVLDSKLVNPITKIVVKRPKGPRDRIIAQVAAANGETRRMVRTCWEEFRRLEKKLKNDEF